MRRIIPFMAMAIIITGSAQIALAQFYEEDAHLWYIRASFGVAGQDLGDVENALNEYVQAFADLGFDLSTYSNNFDNVWDYRVEVGGVVWNRFSVGFCFDYQPRGQDQTVGAVSAADQFRLSQDLSINYHAFLGSITYWMPGTHGLFLGGTVGYGSGRFKQTTTITDPSNPQFGMTASGDYDGSDVVYGFSGGYQYKFESGGLIYVQAGYEWRDLGTFSGSTTSDNQNIVPDYSGVWKVGGEEISWNFSGPFIAVGFGFTGPY